MAVCWSLGGGAGAPSRKDARPLPVLVLISGFPEEPAHEPVIPALNLRNTGIGRAVKL